MCIDLCFFFFFFFKQKTAYEMRISDWSSDVCSSDLLSPDRARHLTLHGVAQNEDGSYSWKFDNYVRPISPVDVTLEEMRHLWSRITCPEIGRASCRERVCQYV